MPFPAPFTPASADWRRDRAAIRSVRAAVFIREQSIPAALEWDAMDGMSEHVLVYDARGRAIATGRLQQDGRIGRIAVLREWRGRGIGTAVLRCLLERAAARGLGNVYLHARTDAARFYRAAGFLQRGEVFNEAGIPHVCMTRGAG